MLPLFGMQALNGKGIPAFKILLEEWKVGRLKPGMTVYVPSSGNTVLNVAYYASAFAIGKVVAVIDASVPIGKQVQLRLPGAIIEHPREGQTTIEGAYELQKENGGLVIDQYKHGGSVRGHQWTMNHIALQMRNVIKQNPSFLFAGGGTCSTLVAAEQYLKQQHFKRLQVIGVACSSKEEQVPGCRTLETIERDVTFDWKKAIAPDDFVFGDKKPAFEMSRALIKEGIPAGPSFGLALEGFLRRFRELYDRGVLSNYLNNKNRYAAIGIAMDASPAYGPEYLDVLGPNL